MHRVFDTKKHKWIKENVYLTQNDEVYIEKKCIFGWKRLVSDDRYVYHRDIGMYDKNNVLIYEGDYIKCQVDEDRIVVGMVAFAHEFSSYIMLCNESNEWFSLGSEVTEYIEVFGNVFDGYKGKDYGEPAL